MAKPPARNSLRARLVREVGAGDRDRADRQCFKHRVITLGRSVMTADSKESWGICQSSTQPDAIRSAPLERLPWAAGPCLGVESFPNPQVIVAVGFVSKGCDPRGRLLAPRQAS
jgi:hypothetical protein